MEEEIDPALLARSQIANMVEMLKGVSGRPANRETALAITKLEEAALWLGAIPKLPNES